jgi:hypothetical protein
MPLTKLENELRARARVLIEQGRLPRTEPARTWGGYGINQPCAVCAQPISSTEVEYEVREGNTDYRLHFICHAAWQFELARRQHLERLGDDKSKVVGQTGVPEVGVESMNSGASKGSG